MKRAELRNLVRQLGGPTVVGKACGGITSQAVNHWDRVPFEHAPILEKLARERSVTRSDGTPYTCELLRPDLADRFAVMRNSLNPSLGEAR